ncbi:hypothetical protein ABT213_29905 [Streptomyces sp. NPDC001674]|uniref:hypothetical protein n=1 Tax=Streptomyces sp. NPDC001674 TaxID=3154394 RepID=UPI00331C6323
MTETKQPPFRPEGVGIEAGDTMCTACRWTYSMACPECAGCGCYTGQCSGWRHSEYGGLDDDGEPYDCGDDGCPGCDECSPYGLAYGQVGW